MVFLVQLIQAIAIGLLTEKWPGIMLAFMNTLAGIIAAWITATVATSFNRDTAFIRLVALATFLVYLATAYLWLRIKSAKGT